MLKEKWRLIIDPPGPGSRNMAADYALLKSVSRGDSLPAVRFYGWARPAITVGYFQLIEEELDRELCERDRVDILRRITGGGAVFHDREITYSVLLPLKSGIAYGTVMDSYRKISRPLVETLKRYGIAAEYREINDIAVSGRKISGSAQTRREGILLQHGTILLDADERMFRYLKKSFRGEGNPLSRIITLRHCLGDAVLADDFRRVFIEELARSFGDVLDLEFSEESLSETEEKRVAAFEKRIFGNPRWNLHRKGEI